MIVASLVWLVVLTVIASLLSYTAMVNMFRGASEGLVFGLAIAVHIATATSVALLISLGVALVAQSLLGFFWGSFSYFTLQRFAGPMQTTMLVRNAPWLYPVLTGLFFLSSVASILLTARWYWAIAPAGLWILVGFLCAEISIRQYIRGVEEAGGSTDREIAKMYINENQGRRNPFHRKRYPFP